MKVGYFCNPSNPGHERAYVDCLNDIRDLSVFCDRAGLDSIWFAEHHFSIWGREILPNPIVMATDIAARTTNIRIGLAAAIITFWHPLRLAEDIALLDQLSNGRLELGVGRGNYGLEGVNLNPAADPRNPEENFKVFADTVAILKKALSQRIFSHKGTHYTYPAPGFRWDRAHPVDDANYIDTATGELINITTFPRPMQTPMPPMWQVVDSPLAVQFAAENDMGIIMWRPPVEMLKERFRLYQERATATRGRNIPFGSGVSIMRDTFVGETEAEARRMAESYLMRYLNWSNWRGPKIFLKPDEELPAEQEAALKKELTFEFVNDRSLLFGTPAQVVDKIEELQDELNIEQLLINSSWSGMPHEYTMSSMKLFADKVLPRIHTRSAAPKSDRVHAAAR
ncbi:MAG: LLM class flavin-dependent oxidoreductase [Rhodospirillaceae bacterium]|nr:LLM class flavin-dependent oxidoreductase [Rhodospirillaceae bacterium]